MTKVADFVVGFVCRVIAFVIFWAVVVAFLLIPCWAVQHNSLPWWQDAIFMGFGIATAKAVHLTWRKKW